MADYGLITGIANGLTQGIKSYQETQKNDQLLQDKIQERQIAKLRQQSDIYQKGLIQDPTSGAVTVDPNNPFTQDRQLKSDATLAEHGLMRQAPTQGGLVQGVPTEDMSAIEGASTQVPQVLPSQAGGLVKTPDQLKKEDLETRYKESQIKSANALANQRSTNTGAGGVVDANGNTVSTQQQRVDSMAHRQVVNAIKNDKQLSQRLAAENNINNALATISDPNIALTPQQIHEFQQTLRSNMGIKGTGGVGERESTYITSLGMNAANAQQLLTGDPVSLARDSKLMNHFKDLAQIEKNNVEHQAKKRLNALGAGYGSMYSRRPDLKADLDDLVSNTQGQFGTELQGLNGAIKDNVPGLIQAVDPDAQTYAQMHNLPLDQAAAIIRKRKGQ